MPTYDYECEAWGHEFELFQSIMEPVQKKCPKCGKLKLRRLFGTGAAVIFKGSGFYETDYRSDSYKASAKADTDAGKGSAGGTDSGKGTSSGTSSAGGTTGSTPSPSTSSSDSNGSSPSK